MLKILGKPVYSLLDFLFILACGFVVDYFHILSVIGLGTLAILTIIYTFKVSDPLTKKYWKIEEK